MDCKSSVRSFVKRGWTFLLPMTLAGWQNRSMTTPGRFQRRGKFKNTPNMNFAMEISCKLEDKLKNIEPPDYY
jgi:hypothetical protein